MIKDEIGFADDKLLFFETFDLDGKFIGVGKNSGASMLAYELYHGFNDRYDTNTSERLNDHSMSSPLSENFTNREEQYVTLSLQNQTNIKLNEDLRQNYGQGLAPSLSPISKVISPTN